MLHHHLLAQSVQDQTLQLPYQATWLEVLRPINLMGRAEFFHRFTAKVEVVVDRLVLTVVELSVGMFIIRSSSSR